MPSKQFPEEKFLLPRNEVNQSVSVAALQVAHAKLPDFERFGSGSLRKTPTSIYDINGKLLFLDYPVMVGKERIGKVRGAASKVLGAPVIAVIQESAPWEFETAVAKLAPRLRKEYKDWTFDAPRLVCYSYPKIGVMYSGKNPQGKRARLIFDVASYDLIPEMTEDTKDLEGAFAWSFYDYLSDERRERAIRDFDTVSQARLKAPAGVLQKIVSLRTLDSIIGSIADFDLFFRVTTRELAFCSHYRSTEARSHHCFVLHAQQVNDYCAVATCQMILCYYRYFYTQDQIAPSLSYSAGSGCPADQSPGYQSLSNNHIIATFDSSPTFAEAKTQINNLNPFKTGIPGHARACAGYSQSLWYDIQNSQSLKIYDPWPWNADFKLGGAVYWEDWNAVTHTNYVFTRLNY